MIGPNGAGKSTLLKAMAGLLPSVTGCLRIFGKPPRHVSRQLAYVPQRNEVDWRFPLNALDVVLMGRDAHLNWPYRLAFRDRTIAMDALTAVGMAEHARTSIAKLSGGQQQRVFLARALAQEAALLLLDEPFVGVDAATEEIIYQVIDQLVRVGTTVIVATHDLLTVADHFDQAVLLRKRIIANGEPTEVLQPASLAVAYGGPLALFQERMPHG
jgi:ABC-type Mn2+/Zn2+ transport system ATPase subunit